MMSEGKKPKWKGMLITPQELKNLPEYSGSLPTGTFIGKIWKRAAYEEGSGYKKHEDGKCYWHGERVGWWLGRYEKCDDPTKVNIEWYVPLVMDSPKPLLRGVDREGRPLDLRKQMDEMRSK